MFTVPTVLAVMVMVATDAPRPVSAAAKRQVARGLVEQLASPNFKERNEAERELLELGAVVTDEVKAGLKSDSAEVIERCERILPKLRAAGLQSPDNPVFKRFLEVAGDSDGAKKLYALILTDPDRLAELERIAADPKAVAKVYQTAVDEMVTKWGDRNARGSGRGFGHPAPRVDPTVPYLLFLGSYEQTRKITPTAGAGDAGEAWSVLMCRAFNGKDNQRGDGRMLSAPHPEMRTLLSAWVANRSDTPALLAVAETAFWCEQPEFLPAARAVLLDKSLLDAHRGWLIQHIGRFGTKDDAKLLAKLFDDDAVFASVTLPDEGKQPGGKLTATVGDAARAYAVRLLGYNPTDLGFAHWNRILPEKTGNGYEVEFARPGFVNDASRKAAAAAVDELLKLPAPKFLRRHPPPVERVGRPGVAAGATAQNLCRPDDPKDDPFWTKLLAIQFTGYTDDDFARVYATAVGISAKTEGQKAEATTKKFAEWCLKRSRDAADRAAVHTALAGAALRLMDTPLPEDRLFPARRANAAKHLLDGYAELLDQKQPAERPEVPKVAKPGPDATAKERAEFVVANAARRDAQYVCDLLDARAAVVDQLRDLYKPDTAKPGRDDKGPDELKTLAEKKLPAEAVAPLMKAIK